jgi:hypothetical protein
VRKLSILILFSFLTLGLVAPEKPRETELVNDPVQVIASSASVLDVGISLPEPQFGEVILLDGETYDKLSVEGSGSPEPGKPDTPLFGRWILIPKGTTPSLVSVEPGSPATLATDMRLNPVQSPWPDVEEPIVGPFVKDEAVFGVDADYPGVFASLGERQVLRGQQMALLRLYPYQYNPTRNTLKAYPNLRVVIGFEGAVERFPDRLRSKSFDILMRHLAINANEVLTAEYEAHGEEAPGAADREATKGPYGWDYIILTPAHLEAAANQLASWRQKSGFKTLVEVVPAGMKAAKLKQDLQSAYDKWQKAPEYVLILGDAEYIPTHYRTAHPFDVKLVKSTNDLMGHIGSDLYYALLDSGNPQDPEADLEPDIHIGRISVDTLAEAQERVQGIIDYEAKPNSDPDFYQNVTLATYFQDGYTCYLLEGMIMVPFEHDPDQIEDARYAQTCEDIAVFLSSSPENKTINRLYYHKASLDPLKWNDNKQSASDQNWNGTTTQVGGNLPSSLLKSNGFAWDADKTDIDNAINAGSFLVIHRDHGNRVKWSNPAYSTTEASNLNNMNKLPVVWSINCETGWFDNETDLSMAGESDWTQNSENSLSEIFERPANAHIYGGDYGALGVVAATRITDSWLNDRLVQGMMDAIWPDYAKAYGPNASPLYEMSSVLLAGEAHMLAVNNFNFAYMDADSKAQVETYHWFGDPASWIRTKKPLTMMAVKPSLLYALYRPILLHVQVTKITGLFTLDVPAEDAKVTISRADNPDDYWVGYTDNEGNLNFEDFQATSPGLYDFIVTAQDGETISDTLEVLPGQAAGIVMDAQAYTCSDNVTVRLADADLAEQSRTTAVLTTASGDHETIALAPVTRSGAFSGSMPLALADSVHDDGVLQVGDWDWITASYFDEDDGERGSGYVTAMANVDCAAPLFEGVESATLDNCKARLAWQPAEDDNGPVLYNVYRDQTQDGQPGPLVGTTWSENYVDFGVACGRTYFYMVRAQDRLGNLDGNTHELKVFLPGLYLPLVIR